MTTTTNPTQPPDLEKNLTGKTSPDDAYDYSEAEEIIKDSRLFLAKSKNELSKIPTDTRITQWGQTNFDTHAKLIKFLGLPPTIVKARDQHTAEGQRLLRHIEKFENELGALEVDIRLKTIAPDKAITKIKAIVSEESADTELVKSWQEHIKTLRDGDEILRHKLALEVLTPFVKDMAKRKGKFVEAGYNVYKMFKDDGKEENKESLAAFQLQAIDLEKRLQNIDLSGLSGLGQDIISHQVEVAISATDQTKAFIEQFRAHLPKQVKAIDKNEEDLIKLRVAPVNKILAEIEKLSAALSQNLIDLNNDTESLRHLHLLPVLLDETTLLQRTIRNSLLPELKAQIATPDSPLNPQTIATEMAADFFMGIKGLLRIIKLLFYSAGSQHPLNSIELQKIIIQTISSCQTFHGKSKEDVTTLKNFIDEQISEFNRPFPYNDLLKILKKAIATYGSRFEQSVFAFKVIDIDPDLQDSKTNLGNLIAVIKKHSSNLQ